METSPDSMMYIENIEQALEYMEEAIRYKIRKIDVCTRYSAMQYLIILFEPDESQIPKVMDRIFIQYYKLYDKRDFMNTQRKQILKTLQITLTKISIQYRNFTTWDFYLLWNAIFQTY